MNRNDLPDIPHSPQQRSRSCGSRVGILLVLVSLLPCSVAMAQQRTGGNDEDYRLNTGLETFGRIYREVADGYIDAIDPEQIMLAGIQAMLERLDPYTVYNPNKNTDETETLSTGSYTGIGISVGLRDSVITITDINEGYSAQKAGVRIGDQIISIDSVKLQGASLATLRRYIRGKPNTMMNMAVHREGIAKPITFTIKRDIVTVRSMGYSGWIDSAHGIGYLRLERFGVNAADEIRTALLGLQKDRILKGLILDLRGNPGGLLDAAVDVCSKFVPNGSVIVSTKGRDAVQEKVYRSEEEPVVKDVPLIVLIDNNSASASEIVAGAIQDLDVGIIMGTPSFGKGLVQSVRQLPNDATLKLTTARYYTPSGRCIQKIDYNRGRFSPAGASVLQVTDTTAPKDFRTRTGRTVTDRTGIQPDSVVNSADTMALSEQLRRTGLYFRFANIYTSGITSLPANFMADDTLLKRFEDFAENMLPSMPAAGGLLAKARELHDAAVKQRLNGVIMQEIQRLENDIAEEYRARLHREREDVRAELSREISGRFVDQVTRSVRRLDTDRQVKAAVGLLITGKRAYSRLLGSADKVRDED